MDDRQVRNALAKSANSMKEFPLKEDYSFEDKNSFPKMIMAVLPTEYSRK
jgi:hypothetical protein